MNILKNILNKQERNNSTPNVIAFQMTAEMINCVKSFVRMTRGKLRNFKTDFKIKLWDLEKIKN